LEEQAKASKKGIVAPHMIKKTNRWVKDNIAIPRYATNACTRRNDRATSLVASRESADIAPSIEERAGSLLSVSEGSSTRQKEAEKTEERENDHLYDDGYVSLDCYGDSGDVTEQIRSISLEETNVQHEEQNDEHGDQVGDVEHDERNSGLNDGTTLESPIYTDPGDDGTDSGDSEDEVILILTAIDGSNIDRTSMRSPINSTKIELDSVKWPQG
jgi:hypothetical protein